MGVDRNILERRQHTRYSVGARVSFKWQDAGVLYLGSGLTRDISTSGMFIDSDSVPPEKADVELDVSFPTAPGADTNLRMSVTALVIRVNAATSAGEHRGFAVLNRSYALSDAERKN